jgi:hypothetical protein
MGNEMCFLTALGVCAFMGVFIIGLAIGDDTARNNYKRCLSQNFTHEQCYSLYIKGDDK